jgi:pyruvate,water dikinase
VYASTFGPDPIQYRAERNLLDFQEGMGVLIQEVVGTHIGDYFLPAFAGVAFSHNEFRWSPRIKREDGLVRLVPGLGTRAVDRLGDDFPDPRLARPARPAGQRDPGGDRPLLAALHGRHQPEPTEFETVAVADLAPRSRRRLPAVEQLVSVCEKGTCASPCSGRWISRRTTSW